MSTADARVLEALTAELTDVVGTLTTSTAEMAAGTPPGERQWYATLRLAGDGAPAVGVAIDQERAAMFARLVSGGAGGVEEVTVSDLLRNALSQAATALGMRPEGERVELRLESLSTRTQPVETQFVSYAISAPALPEPLVLALGWVEAQDVRAARPDRAGSRIDVILDIDLPVVVRFGHTELPIRALSRLGPGSVIDLGRSPDDPVEVLVSNRVVAHGEVVIVGGNYGVRILDVASQSERARSMEE
jgi:flagellar motor switch protein FliN/FliY